MPWSASTSYAISVRRNKLPKLLCNLNREVQFYKSQLNKEELASVASSSLFGRYRFFDADFLLGLHSHRVGLWVIAIGAVPLDGELRYASVQGIALQRLQSVGVVEHFLRIIH